MTEPTAAKAKAFQEPHIARVVESITRHGVAADTSCTGAGKTYIALLAAKALGKRVCVLCPKIVIPAWQEAAAACGVKLVWARNYENLLAKANQGGSDPDIAPFQWVVMPKVGRWYIPKGSMLVCDEAHKLSGETSKTACMLQAARRMKIPTLLLSATLAESPIKLKSIGYALGLHNGSEDGFEKFLRTNGVTQTPWGRAYAEGAVGMQKIRSQLAEKIGGLTPADIPDLPENFVQMLALPTGQNPDHAYRAVLENLELHAADPLVAMLRARQIAEYDKAEAIAEHALLAHEEGNAPVIFVNFRETGERLMELLSELVPLRIDGDVSDRDRKEVMAQFQCGVVTCLICQISAGGVGISLHRTSLSVRPRVSFISPGFSARDFLQALGRIRRVGGVDSQVVQKIVYAEDSEIESTIANSIRQKIECLDSLNDSDLAGALFSLNTH